MELMKDKIIDDIEDLIVDQKILPNTNRSKITYRSKRSKDDYIKPTIFDSPVPEMHRIYIKTWGCTHNTSDSEYMAGLLSAYGYRLTKDPEEADLWLLNSCTVKDPAESHFRNEIEKGQKLGKHIVAAGCVPQGAPKLNYIKNLSIIGIHNIDRVVEVVEETLKGHSVRLFSQKKENGKKLGGTALLLPKVRKNPYIEIIPISTGCLNQCTYCKTKHARGELGSYPVREIVERARQAFSEGVVELWLTSEDTGAYGKDIGTSLPELLWQVIEVIPENCRMRVGMTNPPYILEHLEEMAKILSHKKVYSFLHVPVQSGSDAVLADMKREYTIADFKQVVDFLRSK